MKQLLDKAYNLFSEKLSTWFILAGICCLGLNVFITFMGDMIAFPQEAFNYIMTFLFGGAVIAGIVYGHYFSKEPVLLVSFLVYFILLVSTRFIGCSSGASMLEYATTTGVLLWIFGLFYGFALGALAISVLIVYLFKVKKGVVVLEASYLATLFFGYLYWIFGIVYAADTGVWTRGVLPLFEVSSLLMVPGLLENILPGELESKREEEEEAE